MLCVLYCVMVFIPCDVVDLQFFTSFFSLEMAIQHKQQSKTIDYSRCVTEMKSVTVEGTRSTRFVC